MKTNEELNALKNEVKAINKKLEGLSADELNLVTGGFVNPTPAFDGGIGRTTSATERSENIDWEQLIEG